MSVAKTRSTLKFGRRRRSDALHDDEFLATLADFVTTYKELSYHESTQLCLGKFKAKKKLLLKMAASILEEKVQKSAGNYKHRNYELDKHITRIISDLEDSSNLSSERALENFMNVLKYLSQKTISGGVDGFANVRSYPYIGNITKFVEFKGLGDVSFYDGEVTFSSKVKRIKGVSVNLGASRMVFRFLFEANTNLPQTDGTPVQLFTFVHRSSHAKGGSKGSVDVVLFSTKQLKDIEEAIHLEVLRKANEFDHNEIIAIMTKKLGSSFTTYTQSTNIPLNYNVPEVTLHSGVSGMLIRFLYAANTNLPHVDETEMMPIFVDSDVKRARIVFTTPVAIYGFECLEKDDDCLMKTVGLDPDKLSASMRESDITFDIATVGLMQCNRNVREVTVHNGLSDMLIRFLYEANTNLPQVDVHLATSISDQNAVVNSGAFGDPFVVRKKHLEKLAKPIGDFFQTQAELSVEESMLLFQIRSEKKIEEAILLEGFRSKLYIANIHLELQLCGLQGDNSIFIRRQNSWKRFIAKDIARVKEGLADSFKHANKLGIEKRAGLKSHIERLSVIRILLGDVPELMMKESQEKSVN